MRFKGLLLAGILACGVAACAKDVTGVAHPPPPLAYVRYINAVSDTFNMDFRAVDQTTYSQPFVNVLFRGLGDGNYQGYEAGSRHIRVFLDPNPATGSTAVDPAVVSTIMVDTTYTFTAGTYYTLLEVGSARAKTTKFWIIADALPTQSTSTLAYRVINVAPVQGAVDVYANATGSTTGAAAASSLAYQSATSYISQSPGPLIIKLTAPGTQTVVGAAAGYTLQVGTAGTTAADPIYGSGQGGSILTAFIFDATPSGSKAAAFSTPGVVYFPDMQPPRTTSP